MENKIEGSIFSDITEKYQQPNVTKDKTSIFSDITEKYLPVSEKPIVKILPEAGTYSQDDMAQDDVMFSIIKDYMDDRYGKERFKEDSREELVDRFLNNRRGVSGGNSLRSLKEMDFINDIKRNPEKKRRAALAYQLYEDMAGLYSKETTFAEKAEGTIDYIRQGILDPVNLAGGLIGKTVANGSIRVGMEVAKRTALQAMKKEATEEAAEAVGKKVFKDGLKAARKSAREKINNYAQETLGKTARQRLMTRKALAEIGIVTAVDAVAAVGTEYLYQTGLVNVDVREKINPFAIGIAAAGSIIMGGGQAALIARRGFTGTTIQTQQIPEPDAKGLLSETEKQIEKYLKQTDTPIGRDWKTKIQGGAELSKGSNDFTHDFFKVLLLGHAEEDKIIFKGMTQIAHERGFVWSKRFEDDNFTNWMADLISDVSDKEAQDFLGTIEKVTGNKIRVVGDNGEVISRNKVTGKDIGDILSYKMSQAGSTLNLASQSAKELGLSITDLELKDLYESAIDAGFVQGELKKGAGKTEKRDTLLSKSLESIAANQNRLIRLLVAHPSTSYLNVVGWGANSALNSVSDITLSLLLAGRGTMQRLSGKAAKGAKTEKLARDLIAANASKVKFLLDPDMSYTAFESALQRNSAALQKLNSVLPGGVEATNKLLTGGNFSPGQKLVGMRVDDGIDMIQKLTLVQAQDAFTKSQEFLFQMDLKLRNVYGKGWNEFYDTDGVAKLMATKEYRQIEAEAVENTLENIFSKSYAGKDTLGQVAKVIEDLRNVPGLGMVVPFGRFFNNTIAFILKNTPGVNMGLRGFGYFKSMKRDEAFARSFVTTGLLIAMSKKEEENIKEGLPMYSTRDPFSGEVVTQKYDFPISYYKGLARVLAHYRLRETGEREVGESFRALKQLRNDFSIRSLVRNLDAVERDILEFGKYIIDPERRDIREAFHIAGNTLLTQYANPITRPLEPLNVVVGLGRGENAAPIDRYQNNKLLNNALRYVDNIYPLFFGGMSEEARQTVAGGRADIQSSKILGSRNIRLTDTQRILARMALPEFNINAARKVRDLAPAAANSYNGILHDIVEHESTKLLKSKWFEKLTPEEKIRHWTNDVLPRSKSLAKTFLRMKYQGPEEVNSLLFDITNSYKKGDVQAAIKKLDLNDLEKLNKEELFILELYLKNKKSFLDLKIFKKQLKN